MTEENTYLLGVDSGGSHVTADCYDEQGEVVGHGEAGPGNIVLDLPQTLANIVSAIEEATATLPNKDWKCQRILIGTSGWESSGMTTLGFDNCPLADAFTRQSAKQVVHFLLGLLDRICQLVFLRQDFHASGIVFRDLPRKPAVLLLELVQQLDLLCDYIQHGERICRAHYRLHAATQNFAQDILLFSQSGFLP